MKRGTSPTMAKKPRSTAGGRTWSNSFSSHAQIVWGVGEQLLSKPCSISDTRKVSKRQKAQIDGAKARKQLVGANKFPLLCVGIVARHSSRGRILTLLCVGVVLERFAGTG